MKAMYPRARLDDLVVRDLGDELMIYDRRDNRGICLNAVTAAVWRACDGNTAISQLKPRVCVGEHQDASDEAITFALDLLKKAKLLENPVGEVAHTNRRDLLRGFGAVAAVPAVTIITVPAAAQQASCKASGQPCSNSGVGGDAECCSRNCQPVRGGPGHRCA